MLIPVTRDELLEHIARETARMSYPGSMSRGKKPVVTKGTKAELEKYFALDFPMQQVWSSASELANVYERWHEDRTNEIAAAIQAHVSSHNKPEGVAAKFLNTFMYQLMKHEPCRPLLPALHLPLDVRVFSVLSRLKSPALKAVRTQFFSSPYSLSYSDHQAIQQALLVFMNELNSRHEAEFTVKSRIELNWLWI